MNAPEAGLCRSCGALAQYLNGTWITVAQVAPCRYGAPVHSDMLPDPRAAQMIRDGLTRAHAGTYSVA